MLILVQHMRRQSVVRQHDWKRRALRASLMAWGLTVMLVTVLTMNPDAALASPLQQHGALQRHGEVGIVSHRGAAAVAPENTLAAVQAGIDQGVDFVEIDVQLTSDGVPVLMHDETIERTTNGYGDIAQFTLEQVKTLDAGSWFSADFAGEQVPTLDEFIQLLSPAPVSALIELKGEWNEDAVIETTEMLRSHQLVNRVVLQSFEEPTLQLLHAHAPEYARLLLTRSLDMDTLQTALDFEVSAIGARAALYDDHPDAAARFRDLGMGVLVYTLNEEDAWSNAIDRGNDLIITDDPVALADWRADNGFDLSAR